MRTFNTRFHIIALIAVTITLFVFLRALFCDFVNLDDPFYIYENPAIRTLDWQFIREAFTTSYMGWWMPLTWISFAVDYHFWQLNPLGYHLVNVLLHAANAGLVVLIADRILRTPLNVMAGHERSPLFFPVLLLAAALLWGIHPMRVESVAWATERKDVLSGFLSLACILQYLSFVQKRSVGLTGAAVRNYCLSLILLVLAMMAKPVSVVIPAMFLVIDWYPLGRLKKGSIVPVLLEKIPFLLAGAAVAAVTIVYAAGETILVSFDVFPLHRRLIVAGNGLVEYLRSTLYPVGLSHLYLLPQEFPVSYYVNSAVSLLITGWCIFNFRKKPWLLATWLLFVLPLVPVLGLFQNGAQSHADRFTYLSSAALAIAAAGAAGTGYMRLTSIVTRRLAVVLSAVLLLAFGSITVYLIGSWKDSETLWTRLIRIQPVGRAYYYRGEHYLKKGNYTAAIDDLQVSIRMAEGAGNPEVLNLYALRGYALYKAGRLTEAVKDYSEAIARYPDPSFYFHRGETLKAMGRIPEAEEDFRRAGGASGSIEWRPMW